MMNTTQKEHDARIKKHIINWIDTENYDVEAKTDKEKLQFLYDTFKSEYGFMIGRIGTQRAFAEYCQGLPSCFGLPFTNYDILELARDIGTLAKDASEAREGKILDNYWNYIANKTMQLWRTHGIAW